MGSLTEILEDWAHLIVLDSVEIEKERGVVVEEWRLGRGAQARMLEEQFPILFSNSKYAERLPIGKREVVESAPRSKQCRIATFFNQVNSPSKKRESKTIVSASECHGGR